MQARTCFLFGAVSSGLVAFLMLMESSWSDLTTGLADIMVEDGEAEDEKLEMKRMRERKRRRETVGRIHDKWEAVSEPCVRDWNDGCHFGQLSGS